VVDAAPLRRPGSIRRTSHLDVTRDDASSMPLGVAAIAGAARDLLTTGDDARVVAEAALRVEVGPDGTVSHVEHEPRSVDLSGLLGGRVGFGSRSRVKDVLRRLAGTPLGLLVDDLSGAPAPSGYGAIRERQLLGLADMPRPVPTTGATQTDVCAGWRAGGLPERTRAHGLAMPFTVDPPVAPSLVDDDDAIAWHPIGAIGPRQSRRIRRLDVWREADRVRVDAMFRDSTADPDLTPRVVHEYTLTATLDGSTFVVLSLDATPRALPFPTDCPLAAASSELIVGQRAGDLRAAVRRISHGPISCTHLNDLYRSLADVPALAGALP
jgi:Protein of unknown function (DUF2889)